MWWFQSEINQSSRSNYSSWTQLTSKQQHTLVYSICYIFLDLVRTCILVDNIIHDLLYPNRCVCVIIYFIIKAYTLSEFELTLRRGKPRDWRAPWRLSRLYFFSVGASWIWQILPSSSGCGCRARRLARSPAWGSSGPRPHYVDAGRRRQWTAAGSRWTAKYLWHETGQGS